MTLIKPLFNEYRALEIYEYLKETLEDLKKTNFANALFQGDYNKILPLFNQLDQATYHDRTLPLTEEIKKHDTARDHAYAGLRLTIRGFTHHYDNARATAAKTLLAIFKRYPDAIHQGYNEESGILANLTQDLLDTTSPGRAALLALDGGGNVFVNWAENLRTHNTDLRNLLDERYTTLGRQGELPRITEVRPAILVLVKELLEKIAANATAGIQPAVIPALLATINQRTEKFNQVARERRARHKDGDEMAEE